jgi:hypothetical protein
MDLVNQELPNLDPVMCIKNPSMNGREEVKGEDRRLTGEKRTTGGVAGGAAAGRGRHQEGSPKRLSWGGTAARSGRRTPLATPAPSPAQMTGWRYCGVASLACGASPPPHVASAALTQVQF